MNDDLYERAAKNWDAVNVEIFKNLICKVYNIPYDVLFGEINMEPWKERFVKERSELMERTLKLDMMLQKWDTGRLDFEPKCPKKLLQRQLEVMAEYLEILDKRAEIEGIPLFEKEEEKPAPPTLVTSQHFCYECKNFDGEKGKCRLPGTPDDPYYCGLANFWEK